MKNKKIKIYAEYIEESALIQFNEAMSLDCAIQGALMPDVHTGYTIPIGAVWKTKEKIFPSAVGYDIGCGVCAVKTSINIEDVSKEKLQILKNKIIDRIPLGTDRHQKPQQLIKYNNISLQLKDVFENLAPYQIGTLGGGNHFIEIGKDYSGFLNIIIHSGSRGVGHKIAHHYMKIAHQLNQNISYSSDIKYIIEFDNKNINWFKSIQNGKSSLQKYNLQKLKYILAQKEKESKPNIEGLFSLDINTKVGKSYINDMNCAIEFALNNRRTMIEVILKILEEIFGEINTSRFINRNHNHAEIKGKYVIHRKGATHAENGMMGVIPGNMKDGSFIVKGKGNIESICSSSHGAGRILSRSQANKTLNYNELQNTMENIVTNLDVTKLDESPKAYKNIFEVMKLQQDLVEVIDRIIPILNIKG
jgi:tRNA-splicing ligase RtcB